jgi:hypothetical protein
MMKLRRMPKTQERGPGAPGARFLPIGLIAGPAGSILTGVLRNWKIVLFGILVAVITYQNTMTFELLQPFGVRTIPGIVEEYEDKLAKAEEKVRIAQEQVIECDLSRERLKGAIEATNAQVERWAALSSKLQAEHSNLSQELVKLTQQSNTEIQVILDGPVPQTCEGAIKLLRDAVTNGDLKW